MNFINFNVFFLFYFLQFINNLVNCYLYIYLFVFFISLPRAARRECEPARHREQPHAHLLYCAIFRWPDLSDGPEEVKSLPTCKHPYYQTFAFVDASATSDPLICVNPIHYVRVSNVPMLQAVEVPRLLWRQGAAMLED